MLALASARALLEHGLSGIALLDLPTTHAKEQSAIHALGNDFPAAKIVVASCDVTNAETMRETMQKVREELGEFNILCCFAGMVNCVAAEDLPIEQWRRVLDVNTTGSWIAAQEVGK